MFFIFAIALISHQSKGKRLLNFTIVRCWNHVGKGRNKHAYYNKQTNKTTSDIAFRLYFLLNALLSFKLGGFVANDHSSSCSEYMLSELSGTQESQRLDKSLHSEKRNYPRKLAFFLLIAAVSTKFGRFFANDHKSSCSEFPASAMSETQEATGRSKRNAYVYYRRMLMRELATTI